MGSVCSAEPAAIQLEEPGKGQWVKDTRFTYAWSLVSKPLASARDAFGTNCFQALHFRRWTERIFTVLVCFLLQIHIGCGLGSRN